MLTFAPLRVVQGLVALTLCANNLLASPDALIAPGAIWRYFDTGVAPASWVERDFDDSSWPSGPAQLGFGEGDEATLVDANEERITRYFRHEFTVSDPTAWSQLSIHLLRDDGAVVYLNGIEIVRSNLPNGPLDAQTQTTNYVADAHENQWEPSLAAATPLVAGMNVIAVEVHQPYLASSDLSFDFQMSGTSHSAATALPVGSAWYYVDSGSERPGWMMNSPIEKSGRAPLGFGVGDAATVIQSVRTTYFTRTFLIPQPREIRALAIRYLRNDGINVYINGLVGFRDNLPNGGLTAMTRALSATPLGDENRWHVRHVPPRLLRAGDNIIAVEIHQFETTASVALFDLEVLAFPYESIPPLSISSAATSVMLSWPAWAGAWRAAKSRNFASWTFVDGNPTITPDNNYELIIPRSFADEFFRLELP